MFVVHHRVQLVSVLVDGELHVIVQQGHDARTSFRLVSPPVEATEKKEVL